MIAGMKNIDGYVSKDSLYRLISKIRLQDFMITQEQANFICEKIAELPDELEDEDDDKRQGNRAYQRRILF